jgi:hypothetical protein
MNRHPSAKTFVTSLLAGVVALAAVPVMAADEAEARPPAGQMCPQGSYVIGFDAGANIVCSSQPAAMSPDELQAPGSQAPPIASGATSAPTAAPVAAVVEPAAPGTPAPTSAKPVVTQLEVTDVEPWSVVFGKREVTITVTGTGFTAGSMVRFEGVEYRPSVSDDGTRLMVTLPTRDLSIGNYPITVTNGSGDQVRAKQKLAVF